MIIAITPGKNIVPIVYHISITEGIKVVIINVKKEIIDSDIIDLLLNDRFFVLWKTIAV